MFPFERFSICLFTTASFQLSKRRNSPITLVYNTSFVILCCLYCVNITMYLSTLFSRSSNFYRTFIIIVFGEILPSSKCLLPKHDTLRAEFSREDVPCSIAFAGILVADNSPIISRNTGRACSYRHRGTSADIIH